MALPTLPDPAALVTLGVDTHADTHVAAALDHAGRLLDTRTIPTTPAGYAALLAWASTLGTVDRVGVEGTGSYGAGLARWLRAHGQVVVEVDRPDRAARRRQGKADTLDAHTAARAVQAGTAMGIPKAADGQVEMIRSLRLARRSAMKARTQAANQLNALLVTAPDGLRTRLRGLPLAELVTTAAGCGPTGARHPDRAATRWLGRWPLAAAQRRDRGARRPAGAAGRHGRASTGRRQGVGTRRRLRLVAAGDNPDRLAARARSRPCVGSHRSRPHPARPPDIG